MREHAPPPVVSNSGWRRRELAGDATSNPFAHPVRLPPLLSLPSLLACVVLTSLAAGRVVRAAEQAAEKNTEPVVAAPAAATPVLPPEERGLPLLRMFAPRDYRGHEQVWRIAERPDGVLYFGNLNRVIEFDGERWRLIETPGTSYVRGLAADAEGTVWIGGFNEVGRLVPGADGLLVYESLRARVPAEVGDLGTVWFVHATPSGVYFQSSTAVLRWNGAGFDHWLLPEKRLALSRPWEDTIVVTTVREWNVVRPGGRLESIARPPPEINLPRFILPDGPGRALVGTTTEGLWWFEGGEFRRRPSGLAQWIEDAKLYDSAPLPDGRLVLTSLQGGALVVDADFRPEVLLDDAAGLHTDTVIAAHLDRRGVLWLGTDRGVARVEYTLPMRVFNEAHGLGRNGPESLQRVDGRLIVAGVRNVLELGEAEKPTGNPRFRETLDRPDRITNLLRLEDGVLAPGLVGLTWISQGRAEKLEGPGSVREVREIPGQPGRYVGTHIEGLASWRREGKGWVFEGRWPEITGEVRSLVADAEGGLWTSTPNAGAIRFEAHATEPRAARIERFGEEAGLPVSRNRVWLTPVGGAPLFGTERGLHRFDPATRRFRPETGFGAPFSGGEAVVRLVVEDDAGGLWMAREPRGGTPPGVFHGRDGRWEQLPLPDIERLNNFNFLEWERRGDREILWIGGQSELRRLDVTQWRRHPPAPVGRSLVRTVHAGHGLWLRPGEEGARVPARENSLRFTFATPGLGGEPDGVHETQLRGFAAGDVQVARGGERTFTNLPPGAYVFEVRGRTADGRWSEPARFAFTVLAPWWQTPWARAGYVLAGGLLLFAYIRWRIRRLTRERARLETVVAERTAELAEKNRELERLHRVDEDEKLAARLAEERAQLELLRYQLNPHFLYNSLNSIRALVFANAAAAGEMVTRLSEFCRWTLTRGGDGVRTVGEEVEMLQAYLDIERARWQDGVRATVELDPAARDVPLPPFLFLPLIENAIKYGSRTSPGLLEVAVTLKLEDGRLVGEIANSGEWVERDAAAPAESTGIGLDNLRRRLARHYGPETRPEIIVRPGWVVVRLVLPPTVRPGGSRSPV